MTVRWIKRLLGDEGTDKSGTPVVSIDRARSWGCSSGSRLAIPAVSRQGYSSEVEGLSGTSVPSPMSALCSINSAIRKYRNHLPVRQFKTALLIAIGVNPKKRGCVLGIVPNRAAPFIQIETNSVKGYTIRRLLGVSSTFQSRSDSRLYLVLLHGGFERPLGVPTQLSILNETQRNVNTFFPQDLISLYQRKDLSYKQIAEQLNHIFLLAHVKVAPEVTQETELKKRGSQCRSSGFRINLLIIHRYRILLCPFLPVHNQHRKSLATAPPSPIHYQN